MTKIDARPAFSALLILLLLSTACAALSNPVRADTAPSSPLTIFKLPMPATHAPTAPGCYTYVKQKWQATPCLPESQARAFPPPIQGGSLPIYGVQTATPTVGAVWSALTQANGMYDSISHKPDYSVQLNTNYFTGSNGHTDWVQLVTQAYFNAYYPALSYAGGCIWNNDLSNTPFQPTYPCVSLPYVNLNTTWQAFIELDIVPGGLQGTFELCGYPCVWGSVTVSDVYGLGSSGRWQQTSGTLLGYGLGSRAMFYSPAYLATDVVQGYPGNTHGQFISAIVTGESNNLNYVSYNYVGCSNGDCWTDTASSH